MCAYSDRLTPARCGARGTSRVLLRLAAIALAAATLVPAQSLESLAQAFRDSPTPARRKALLRFASAHAGAVQGALARFTLGVVAYEQKDYAAAAENLELARKGLPALPDYTAYYLASARFAAQDLAGLDSDLAPFRTLPAPSPLAGKAILLEAEVLAALGRPADSVRLLRERYAELPQPAGDLALAKGFQALQQLPEAVKHYQRVYYLYPDTDAAAEAAKALSELRRTMGASYPVATMAMRLERIDKWIAAREYRKARTELTELAGEATGADRDIARVRAAALDALEGRVSRAYSALRGLAVEAPEADAERLYYLVYCGRKMESDSAMLEAIERLNRYPKSPWRLKALVMAGNRFLLANRPDQYEPLFRAAFESFPGEQDAAYCQWKVAWNAYLRRRPDAADLLRDHLRRFPASAKASAALYFLGRLAESGSDLSAAAAFYKEVLQRYPNFYYGLLARQHAARPEIARAPLSEETAAFLRALALPEPRKPENSRPTPATERRIARARLLASAGFPDWAEAELRFGAKTDAQPHLIAIELARRAGQPHEAMRAVKSVAPDYLSWSLDAAPQRFWQLLFPLPWRRTLISQADRRALDPFMVAGLIRQESEFNPKAISPARAYGLTQVLPSTGRKLARQEGLRRFRPGMLLHPETNLRLGISYLGSLLAQWSGKWEEALASYNAGKSRVEEWLTWGDYREPAEFVETIPFTETREYVQSVMRNAALYRQLYGDKHLLASAAADPPEEKTAVVRTRLAGTKKKAAATHKAAGRQKAAKAKASKARAVKSRARSRSASIPGATGSKRFRAPSS